MSHWKAPVYLTVLRTAVGASPLPGLISLSHEVNGLKDYPEWGSADFWWRIAISCVLVLAGGAFAGLTLGLMGLDELHLRVLAMSSDNISERNNAIKVLRLLAKGRHWVLVVLLLANVIVNESLPIFLDSAIGGGVSAVVMSTILIVIFGEVIPQAVCARYGLQIGARCAPFVLTLMYIFAPIAWPTAKLLDRVLGKSEDTTYKKAELRTFLQFHRHSEEPLRDDEITILNGVLSLNDKRVDKIMTPIEDAVTISSEMILDHAGVNKLLISGYSRFPVYKGSNKSNFIGLLLIKKLIAYDPDDKLPVDAFPLSILPEAKRTINCFQALDYFQTGRAHLLLITEHPGEPRGAIGVITLEDIIEEIIEEEIVDETDRYESNQSKLKAKRMSTAAIMKGIVERKKDTRRMSNGSMTAYSNTGTPKIPYALGHGGVPTITLDNSALLPEPRGRRSPAQDERLLGKLPGPQYGAIYTGSP